MKAALLLLAVFALVFLGAVALWTGVITPTPPDVVAEVDPSTAGDPYPGFLHGRVETVEGSVYEGRLR